MHPDLRVQNIPIQILLSNKGLGDASSKCPLSGFIRFLINLELNINYKNKKNQLLQDI